MLTRRRFVSSAGGALAATVFAPGALADALGNGRSRRPLSSGRFSEGVMAGEPTPDGITLWTRLNDADGSGSVLLEVARDDGFRRVVASERVAATEAAAHAVKVRVRDLDPREEYFYRFETANRSSDVGRFRTAPPPDSEEPLKFAFFSCQSWQSGFFTPHDVLAREDVDFVVNLGDYVYADAQAAGARIRRDPILQARSLEQYRDKYRLYRSDAALRRMQREFAMVSTWDDHELTDNYAGRDPRTIPQNGFTRRQQANAYRAFFESMPFFSPDRRTRVFRALRMGRNVDLVVLDERQYRDAQACGDTLTGDLDPTSPDFCADLDQPREYVGRAQEGFLARRVRGSSAHWKVVANPVPVTPIKLINAFAAPDAWAGYTGARAELVALARSVEDLVFVTGDIHTFVTAATPVSIDDPTPVAPEFIGGSITSFGFAQTDIKIGGGTTLQGDPDATSFDQGLLDSLVSLNPWAVDIDVVHHGYAVARATPSSFDVSYKRLETVRRRRSSQLPDLSYTVARGQRRPDKVA